ncbi:MAG: hypothetical protein MAG795_00824 [Candidatus Woesearchaeota archaeon]|nr:hypothetical protein [Candidatus Woesearchaeota archaeon]
MKVDVKLDSIKVSKFSPKDFSVEIETVFFDDDYRKFHKTVHVNDSNLAESIIKDIKNMINNRSVEFNGEVIKGYRVQVEIKDKEDVLKKLGKFFSKLKTRVAKVKNIKQAEGYMDAVNRVRILSTKFKK